MADDPNFERAGGDLEYSFTGSDGTTKRVVLVARERAEKSPWNSLESWKFAISVVQAIASAAIAIIVLYTTQSWERTKISDANAQEQRRQLIAKRLKLWETIAPDLNDIYCYFTYVGTFRDYPPGEIVAKKRRLDSVMYGNRLFFSPQFFDAYSNFMKASFDEYGGSLETNAPLRTRPVRPKDKTAGTEIRFTGEDTQQEIHNFYYRMQALAADELDVKNTAAPEFQSKKQK